MTPVHARVDHQAHADQNDFVRLLAMLRTLDAKIEDLLSLLSERRKENYTVEEFAREVGRSDYTARRWISEGKVKAIRVQAGGPRGRLLIPRSELIRVIGSGKGGQIVESAVDLQTIQPEITT